MGTGAPKAEDPVRAVVITVSTSRAEGAGVPDESGEALAALVEGIGGELVGSEMVADDATQIEACLRRWADGGECDLLLTTGGTGLAPSDLTPEATEAVLERRAPGIAEAMRAASAPHTPHWMLSRGVAGSRGSCLIVNFPGNPKAIAETAAALAPALPHAFSLLRGAPTAHRR
jgi:molybdenum cofactor synthesis domain-containing protein